MNIIKFKRYHFDDNKNLIAVTEWGKIKKSFRVFEHSELCFTMPSNVGNTDSFIDCQFTGAIDITSNEIYEGDIVILEADFWQVYYCERNASFRIKSKNHFSPRTLYLNNFEKIGNVYENPELLSTIWAVIPNVPLLQ